MSFQVINTLCQYVLANDIQAVRKLLKDESSQPNFDINGPNSKGYSALYCSAKKGLFDMTLMLINSDKIDVDFQSKQDGNTPLHAAAVKGHGLIVALLLIRGARVRIQNRSKATPRGVAKGDAVDVFKTFEAKGTHGLLEKNKQISQKIVEDFKQRMAEFRDIIKLIGKEIPLFCCNVYLRDQFTSGVLILTTDRVAFCYFVEGKWNSVVFLNNNLFNIAFDAHLSVKVDVKENFGNGIVQYKDITIEFDKFLDKQYFKSYYRKSALCLFEIRNEDRDEFYKLDYDFTKIYERFPQKPRTIDFNVKDSHDNILIEYETGHVRAATFSKLIEKITDDSKCIDLDDFLISYRLFAESEEVLQALFLRYYQVQEKFKPKVFVALQRWVDKYWNDFERNFANNTESVYKFVDPLIKQNNQDAKNVRKRIELKSKEKFLLGLAPRSNSVTSASNTTPRGRDQLSSGSTSSAGTSGTGTSVTQSPSARNLQPSTSNNALPRQPQTPTGISSSGGGAQGNAKNPGTPSTGGSSSALLDVEKGFFEFTPLEIANQWTLLEWSYWQRITDNEWNELGCTKKKNKLEIAPNICIMFKRSKQISDFVATTLLTEEKKKSRIGILQKWIEIAENLRILGNYHGVMEICKGLAKPCIQPLKSTFDGISDTKITRDWQNIELIASSKGNFAEMRKAFSSSQSSALPYLELYLSDVVSAIEKSGPFVNGLIHFNRCRMFASTIKEITQYQPVGFDSIPVNAFLQEFLSSPPSLSDEQLNELSGFIEPKVEGAKIPRPESLDNYLRTNNNQLGLRKDSQAAIVKDKSSRSATPKVGRSDSKTAARGKKGALAGGLLSASPSPSKASLGANTPSTPHAQTATPSPKEAEKKVSSPNSFEIPVSEEKTVDGEIQYLKSLREKLRTNLENEHGDIFSHEKYHGLCVFSPRLLAEQITYRDQQNFVQLLASDELYNIKNWSKPLHSPTLTAVSEYFDKLSCALLTEILTERHHGMRQYMISVVVETMVELLNLQNLHSLLSFWTALSSTSISRLYTPFTPLIMKLIEDLQSPSHNYKNIRDYITNIQKSQTTPTLCIPYLGLYQKDLIYATEVDNSNMNTGKNLSADIIDSLKVLLSVPCTIQPNHYIQKYIQNVYYLDDLDKLYKLSIELAPRATKRGGVTGTLAALELGQQADASEGTGKVDSDEKHGSESETGSMIESEIAKKQEYHRDFHFVVGAYLLRDLFVADETYQDFKFPVDKGRFVQFHLCLVQARCPKLISLRDAQLTAADDKKVQYSLEALNMLKMFIYRNTIAIRGVPVDTISELWALSIICDLNNLISLIKMYIMNEITVSNIVDYMNCFRKWKIPDQDVFLHTAIEKLANSTLVKNVMKKEKERKNENIQIETAFIQDYQKLITRSIFDTTLDVTDVFGAEKKFNVCKVIVAKNSGFFQNLVNTNQLEEKITTDLSITAFESLLFIVTLQGFVTHKTDMIPLDLFSLFEGGAKFEIVNWDLVLQELILKLRRISKNETEEVITFIYKTYEIDILQRYSVIFEQLSFYSNNILKLANFTKKKIAETYSMIMSITPLLKERDKEIENLKKENEKLRQDYLDLRTQVNELKDLFTS